MKSKQLIFRNFRAKNIHLRNIIQITVLKIKVIKIKVITITVSDRSNTEENGAQRLRGGSEVMSLYTPWDELVASRKTSRMTCERPSNVCLYRCHSDARPVPALALVWGLMHFGIQFQHLSNIDSYMVLKI